MSFTSSEIQKKLERSAFSIHIAFKQIEALKAEIAGHENHMFETARSLYENEQLVEAAIAMAQMSIPALEQRASKIVADNISAAATPRTSDTPEFSTPALDVSTDPDASSLTDADHAETDNDLSVVDPTSEAGVDYARIYAEEFFGVEIPVTQFDLAREIKREAAVSVKQNTKNNTYASDRGKNAWRKALFTRARADYLSNSNNPEDVLVATDTVDIDAVTEEVIDAVALDNHVVAIPVETENQDQAVDGETEADSTEEFSEVSDVVEIVTEDDVLESAVENEADFMVAGDDSTPISDVIETGAHAFDDIPFFDDPVTVVSSVEVIEPQDAISTVDDDQTLSIDDTFDTDADIPAMDAMTFEDEAADHGELSSHDDPEDIDVPDFDPNAELFDDKAETSVSIVKDVDAQPSLVNDDDPSSEIEPVIEKVVQSQPEASRRAVSISSLPAHQRPGAPRPASASGITPARPQPGNPSSRVVTSPPLKPTSSASPASEPHQTTPAPSRAVSAPQAPVRPHPGRTPPARVAEAPGRTHGYGAKVPAPDGLEEAIRERDAANAARTAQAPSRPGAAPARPVPGGARPNPPFTKPSFGR
jgi:hypothetical protein